MIVVLEVILQTVIAIIDHAQANSKPDERELKISLLSTRNAYFVLSSGILLSISNIIVLQIFPSHSLFIEQLSPTFNLLHWLVITFLFAETIKLASQLYYERKGC